MQRMAIGAVIGVVSCLHLLAGLGFWYGLENGVPTASTPPGMYAAQVSAFAAVAYFWWLAAGVGGFIGGAAGFGSWLVRPRP